MMTKQKGLTKEEVEVLYYQMKKGDEKARDKLILSNLGIVGYIARKFIGPGIDIDDLIGTGYIGLIKAVDDYDISRRVLLISFIYKCVMNEILMYFHQSKKYSAHIAAYGYIDKDHDGEEYGRLDNKYKKGWIY